MRAGWLLAQSQVGYGQGVRLGDIASSALAGYLLGSVPSADIAAALAGGPDLRDVGSGNPGASNAAAELGPKFGLGVLVADITKGALAASLGRHIGGRQHGPLAAQIAATSAVVGHCYPVWSGFRGGKGVATGVGQVLATFPAFFPIDIAVALATVASPRWKSRSFAATGIASMAWIGFGLLWWKKNLSNLWGPEPTAALPFGALVSTVTILGRFWSERR